MTRKRQARVRASKLSPIVYTKASWPSSRASRKAVRALRETFHGLLRSYYSVCVVCYQSVLVADTPVPRDFFNAALVDQLLASRSRWQ